ncbi:MAG: DUF1289 domain-containing protein [Rudaea sp.]
MRSTGTVASPCISVCRIDDTSGLCIGCLRTIDEIAAWATLDDDARRAVWQAIGERRGGRASATPPKSGSSPKSGSDSKFDVKKFESDPDFSGPEWGESGPDSGGR